MIKVAVNCRLNYKLFVLRDLSVLRFTVQTLQRMYLFIAIIYCDVC